MGKTRCSVALLAQHAQAGGSAVLYHLQGKTRPCLQAAKLDEVGNAQGARDLRTRLSGDKSGKT